MPNEITKYKLVLKKTSIHTIRCPLIQNLNVPFFRFQYFLNKDSNLAIPVSYIYKEREKKHHPPDPSSSFVKSLRELKTLHNHL